MQWPSDLNCDFDIKNSSLRHRTSNNGVWLSNLCYETYLFPGIVNFKYKTSLTDDTGELDSQEAFVSNIEQYKELSVPWKDGNKLEFTVYAIDIMGEQNSEKVTVYKDSSHPVVEDLWLTKGDRLNISVHSVEDFKEMT